MPPISKLKLPQPTREEVAEGRDGLNEARALEENIDLSQVRGKNQSNSLARDDQREQHLHVVGVFWMYLLALCTAAMFLVLVLQYMLPDRDRFLSAEDDAKLQTFLFSGMVGGVLTAFTGRVSKSTKSR